MNHTSVFSFHFRIEMYVCFTTFIYFFTKDRYICTLGAGLQQGSPVQNFGNFHINGMGHQ